MPRISRIRGSSAVVVAVEVVAVHKSAGGQVSTVCDVYVYSFRRDVFCPISYCSLFEQGLITACCFIFIPKEVVM
jgi:hypothetical protein